MSTRFHDDKLFARFRNGQQQGRQTMMRIRASREFRTDPAAGHYFKVYRLGEDLCAKCQKPRSEHPRRKQ